MGGQPSPLLPASAPRCRPLGACAPAERRPKPPLPPAAAGKSGIFEAVLSTNLSHPCIVHTYQYAFRPVTVRTWLLLRARTGCAASSLVMPC